MANLDKSSSPDQTSSPRTLPTGLILMDSSERRRRELDLYRKRSRELEQAQLKMRNFKEGDHPAFGLWFQAEFSRELQILQESRISARSLTEVKFCVEDCAFHLHVPFWQAYETVQAAMNAGMGPHGWITLLGGSVDEIEDEDEDEDDFDENPFDFDISGEAFDSDDEFNDAPHAQGRGQEPASHDVLKGIYRQLARLLHPDMVGETSTHSVQLWHEVQRAYEDNNLWRLQQILQAVQADSPMLVDFSTIAIAEIMALRSTVERQLRQIRRDLAEARKMPSWNFRTVQRSPKRSNTLRQEILESVLAETKALDREHTHLTRLLKLWEKPRGKAKKAPPAKSSRFAAQQSRLKRKP